MGDMDEFSELLGRLRKKIDNQRAYFNTNEAAVRRQLMEPLLQFFGWDMEDPTQVALEERAGEGRADYVLKRDDGKRGLFLEAKSLSKNPSEGLHNLIRYCTDEGVLYGVSCNGEEWLLFRAFEEGKPRKERILWKVNITSSRPEEVFAKLSQISKQNLPRLDERVRQADTIEGLVDRCLQNLSPEVVSGVCDAVRNQEEFTGLGCSDQQLEDIVRGKLSQIVREPREVLPEEREYYESLSRRHVEPSPARVANAPRGKPRAINLFGQTIPVRLVKDILVTVANEMARRGKLTRGTPVQFGHSRYIVNDSPVHPSGKRFRAPEQIHNGLYIETHWNAESTENFAQKLLEHCGYRKSDLRIIW